ncbi:MAG: tetratricopeptide repeat protein [Elusimicrobiota bacterium]
MTFKDKQHWSAKSEVKRDELKDALTQTLDWLILRRRETGMALGAALILGLVAALFLYGRHSRQNAAWDKLALAELYAYSGKLEQAQALLSQLAEEGANPAAASLARMLEGDLRFPRGEVDLALAAYEKAIATAPEPLKPFALTEKVLTLEAVGKAAECAAAAQVFLDGYADSMLAPMVHSSLARCQLAVGQSDAARATLQKISLQYSNTPWAAWANSRLQPPAAPK